MLAVQEFPEFPTLVPLYLFDPLAAPLQTACDSVSDVSVPAVRHN
jgi:hypothetical protein